MQGGGCTIDRLETWKTWAMAFVLGEEFMHVDPRRGMSVPSCSVRYFCLGSLLIFVGSVLLCALGFTVVLPHEATRDWPRTDCQVVNSTYDNDHCSCDKHPAEWDQCVLKYPCLQVSHLFHLCRQWSCPGGKRNPSQLYQSRVIKLHKNQTLNFAPDKEKKRWISMKEQINNGIQTNSECLRFSWFDFFAKIFNFDSCCLHAFLLICKERLTPCTICRCQALLNCKWKKRSLLFKDSFPCCQNWRAKIRHYQTAKLMAGIVEHCIQTFICAWRQVSPIQSQMKTAFQKWKE